MSESKWIVIYVTTEGTQIEKGCKSLEEAKDLAFRLAKVHNHKTYLTYLLEEFNHDKT